jgi:hypothetical protein
MGGPDRGLVRINSLGLRGPEVAVTKPAGTIRVLVFGDSFVFGVGVDEEHLFTSRLQTLLNKRGRAAYEVVNMGVSGYSTDQEYLLFQDLGVRLQPGIVILVACDNDFEGNTLDLMYHRYYKPYFVFAADGQLQLRNVPVPRLDRMQQVKLWLGQHSSVWSGLGFQVAVPHTSSLDEVEITGAIVGAFHDLAERVGADFVLFNTGHRREKTRLFQALRPRLRREGICQLGLEGNFEQARDAAPNALWDFGQDPHWNVDAHLLAAEVVCNFIDKQGLLARREASGAHLH